jgi:hypothetical protein
MFWPSPYRLYITYAVASHQAPGTPTRGYEEIVNLADAVARAQRQIHDGADGIKLFAGAIVGGEVGVLPMPLDQARCA